jgi:hypothetical protein
MARVTRPNQLPLALLLVLAIAAQGCGSSPPATVSCEKYCGNGSATVTFGGATEHLSGGACVDGGQDGIDAKFGDWQGVTNGASGFLELTVLPSGGSTQAVAPSISVVGSGSVSPSVDGSVNGQPFILAPGAVVAITPDNTGSFSGTDVNGGGPASGTFSCR